MHTFQYIAALGAIVSIVAAAPVRGGDFIINTVTEIETVTEILTATVWVDAPGSTSTSSTQVVPTQVPATTTTLKSSVIAASTSSSTSVYVAPVVQTTPTTTATTPASTPTTTAVPTPPTTTIQQAAVVQTPTTTSTYVPPAPTTTTTTPAVAAVTTQSSSSSGSSKTYTGDLTYYDVGLGSCGNTNTDSEMVLAMAVGLMNKATMCGKTVTISYGGSTHTGTIVDTCMGCADGALDLSPALFQAVVPNGDGRVHGVEWWFN